MKVIKFLVIVILLSLLISCPDYNNPIDPDADDYQGWPILGEGEEGEPWNLSGISPGSNTGTDDLTPLISWPDMENADRYEMQWAPSIEDVPGSTVNNIIDSEYQISTMLSRESYVFWRIKVINSAGGTSSWSEIFSFIIPPVDIGDAHAGGIVFYLSYTGGLVAAVSDQSASQVWIEGGSTQTTENWNTSTEIGTGSANTDVIIAQSGHTGSAAQVCRDYAGGGYNDWFLPSKDELTLMYGQKGVIGGFAVDLYWSSSESHSHYAWLQNFTDGNQFNYYKNSTYGVRAVRAFTY